MKKILVVGVLVTLSAALAGLVSREIADKSRHPLDVIYEKVAGGPVKTAESTTIVRRMSLHLRGTIPGIKEIQEFEKQDPDTRDFASAVDFLRSPEFAQYWGSYFESLFRGNTTAWKIPYGGFFKYVAQSLHDNKPYDVLVKEMLVSTGSPDKNPASYFYIRDGGDPLQVAEYVSRLFYAKRAQCARCHNHPFDTTFTRRDYYGIASFFSQQFLVWDSWEPGWQDGKAVPWNVKDNLPDTDRTELDQSWNEWNQQNWNKWSEPERQAYRKKWEVQYGTMFYSKKLGLRYPKSDDEPGGDIVKAKFPDGTVPKIKEGDDKRLIFANWLADRKNDRFRKVIINRIWTRLMGWSFFTPLDDWNAETQIRGREILDHLDQVFVSRNYRIKDLILYIVTSDAYQRSGPEISATPAKDTPEARIKNYFAERLDADQLMNSVIRASQLQTVGDVYEQRKLIPVDESGQMMDVDLVGVGSIKSPKPNQHDLASASEVQRPVQYETFLAVFGSGSRRDIADDEQHVSIEQILTLMNGRLTGRIVWDYGSNKNSYIYQEYQKSHDIERSLDLMYLRTLSRHISPEESAEIKKMTQNKYVTQVDDNQNIAIMNDMIWALINSQEFLHVR